MTEDFKLGGIGVGKTLTEIKSENQLSEESKMNSNIPSGYLGDQNDYSESMLLGQFPDNFDDACGWMTHDDYSDFQQQKRFDGNDDHQMVFNNDNRFNSNSVPDLVGQSAPQLTNQLGQGILQNNGQINQSNQLGTSHMNTINQLAAPSLQTQLVQPQKVQEIMLSSSQYNQQLHEMHLHHLEQISHTTNSSDYYNRPLEGPRSVLPIDSMNHETGAPSLLTLQPFIQ